MRSLDDIADLLQAVAIQVQALLGETAFEMMTDPGWSLSRTGEIDGKRRIAEKTRMVSSELAIEYDTRLHLSIAVYP